MLTHPNYPHHVKVGRTVVNPAKRLGDFNTGCPFGLYQYAALVDVYDARIAEAQLHRALSSRRVKGEWFRVSRRLAVILAKHLGTLNGTP